MYPHDTTIKTAMKNLPLEPTPPAWLGLFLMLCVVVYRLKGWVLARMYLCDDVPDAAEPPAHIMQLSDEEIAKLYLSLPLLDKDDPFCQIRAPTDDTIIKRSVNREAFEASNIDYIRRNTQIPTPAAWRWVVGKRRRSYLVLQRLHGRTLEQAWPSLSLWKRSRVILTVRYYLQQLRALPAPSHGAPGPIGEKPQVCFGHCFTEFGAGPFVSIGEMEAWFDRKLALSAEREKDPLNGAPGRIDTSGPLVMTHGDLHLRNLFLTDDGKLWVLDWDMSGFYPQWFEAVGMNRKVGRNIPWMWKAAWPFLAGKADKPGQQPFLSRASWAIFHDMK